MTRKRTLLTMLFAALAGACQPQVSSVSVPSLDKPGPAAFACYSSATSSFLPTLAECDGVTDATSDLRILSFVLETSRGEVAVIDWHEKRAIDSDRRVPGFTFAKVGESPSAILIPETDSRLTFVANYGSLSVQGIPTTAFVPDSAVDPALVPSTVFFASGPSDLAYVDTGAGALLFAALPNTSQIAVMSVDATTGALALLDYVDVDSTVPAQVAATSTPDYLRLCREDGFSRTATVAPRVPVSLGAEARPTALDVVVRPNGDRELIAGDAALPVIHRYLVGGPLFADVQALGGYATGVPTLDVVSTPPVPATYEPASVAQSATEQYVYAIDAIDRSVLVVDAATGGVLPINVGGRAADRIPYEAGALTLEVLTPGYDPVADPTMAERCDPADATDTRRTSAGPSQLHGVFLSVAMTDGSVGFVDIYDLDATCRGPSTCGGFANANDTLVYIHRHRPRASQLSISGPTVGSTLSFTYQGNAGRLSSTGTPTAGDGPGLLPIDDADPSQKLCPGTATVSGRGQMAAGLVASGDPLLEGEPLICLLDDPAAIRQQRWYALYEGSISAAQGVRGRLVDDGGVHRFRTEDATFCTWGVLGASDVASAALGPNDPELGYGGDMLVISADLPPETMDDPACEGLALEEGTRRVRIAFAILESYQDELVLGGFVVDQGYTLPSALNADPANAFATALHCFPQLVSYDVRVRSAYAVSSTISKTRHRVVDDGSGRCIIDVAGQPFDPAEPDTARAFRALPGRNFIHPEVAFRVSSFDVPSGIAAMLAFDVTGVPMPMRIDIGALGSALEYNPADERLYTVDISSHVISAYQLDPVIRDDRVQ